MVVVPFPPPAPLFSSRPGRPGQRCRRRRHRRPPSQPPTRHPTAVPSPPRRPSPTRCTWAWRHHSSPSSQSKLGHFASLARPPPPPPQRRRRRRRWRRRGSFTPPRNRWSTTWELHRLVGAGVGGLPQSATASAAARNAAMSVAAAPAAARVTAADAGPMGGAASLGGGCGSDSQVIRPAVARPSPVAAAAAASPAAPSTPHRRRRHYRHHHRHLSGRPG